MLVTWAEDDSSAQPRATALTVEYGEADVRHLQLDCEAKSDGGRTYSAEIGIRSGIFSGYWFPTGQPSMTQEEVADYVGIDTKLGQYVEKHSVFKAAARRLTAYGSMYVASNYYESPIIHRAVLKHLKPGRAYAYRLPGEAEARAFRMPPSSFPMSFGLCSDTGQTEVARKVYEELAELSPAAVLLSGDLSYADGYGPRWDRHGRMIERLASKVPVMTCPGNHEVWMKEQFVHYNARWKMPYEASGSTSNLHWSTDIGPVHVVSINTYTRMEERSHQYQWLQTDLLSVDRQKTPWLVAMMHGPWYNTNHAHRDDDTSISCKQLMEQLFFDHGVDLVISGHVHAYERMHPVWNGSRDECGPVYVNLGDGGNYEGAATDWYPKTAWSAFRESSFGFAMVEFQNATHANYKWRKLACEAPNGTMYFHPNCTGAAKPEYLINVSDAEYDHAVFRSWQARCPKRFHSRPQMPAPTPPGVPSPATLPALAPVPAPALPVVLPPATLPTLAPVPAPALPVVLPSATLPALPPPVVLPLAPLPPLAPVPALAPAVLPPPARLSALAPAGGLDTGARGSTAAADAARLWRWANGALLAALLVTAAYALVLRRRLSVLMTRGATVASRGGGEMLDFAD